ncbi:MAG: MBL fold metallo-hydrolase [Akkermansiaceae bacterium]|nr:MBL fold metallo-hydrolase [Akkermansiaceae bacterium]
MQNQTHQATFQFMGEGGISLAVLGSGSKGNSALVRCGSTHILVDAGLSAKQLVLRMNALGITPDQLDAILITHEHSDHAQGVDVLLRQRSIPVFANALTREALSHKMKSTVTWKVFHSGQEFQIGDFMINSFQIPHDAAEPVGFVITAGDTRLSMVSDVGYVTNLMRENLKGCSGLYIEANYDQALLEKDTKRPWATKQRIVSRHGHLSNDQTAEVLAEVACEKLKFVMLSHLSSDCNSPDIASLAVSDALKQSGLDKIDVYCAHQDEPSQWINMPEAPSRHDVFKTTLFDE